MSTHQNTACTGAGLGSVSSEAGFAEMPRARGGGAKAARARSVPRLGLTPVEAAESIGMSADTFDRYVRDGLRWVRCGSKKVVPVGELEQWLDENAERVVPG
jgi:hypothetical protein